tara:strand:- start:2008 stop:4359 length:2352 start_codon:yes stop_codon:yes gene_type:complete
MEKENIQSVIENYLSNNKDKKVISQRKGYRTFSITGRELIGKIGKTMAFLQEKGAKKGDKIIIVGMNSIEWVVVYFSCIFSGITVVPLDVNVDKKLFKKIQNEVGAKAVFGDKRLIKKLGIKGFYLDELDSYIEEEKSTISKISVEPDDVFEIIYTSGATGEPKGVVLTYENMGAGLKAAISLIKLRFRLKILNLLPLSHIYSQMYGLFVLMEQNSEICFSNALIPGKIIDFVRNKRINVAIVVPGILEALRREIRGKWAWMEFGWQFRVIGVGGASLSLEEEKWWRKKGFLLVQGYGLTETCSVVSANEVGLTKKGSVGKVAQGIELKLGKDNEILVRGKNVFKGYYKNGKKESFENGWFKTGDIGEIKNGYVYIKGRKKDVIVTGSGLNVYPGDIEGVLGKVEGVKESCVLEKDGKIHAVLILRDKGNVESIIREANKKLLSHQRVQGYSVWPYRSFPKTALGKTRKFVVAQSIDKLKKGGFSYENKLLEVVNEILRPGKKISKKDKLVDLGMDSLKRLELIVEIEREFGVEVEETKLNQYVKVGQIQSLIGEKGKEKVKFRKWPLCFLTRIVRFVGQNFLFYPLAWVFTRPGYGGLENLRDIKRPVIFVSNHQSGIDGIILTRGLKGKIAIPSSPEIVFGINRKESKINNILRRFRGFLMTILYNAYSFGEKIGTERSLEFTGEFLDRDYSILVFPEGERTKDGKIKKFKPGIGYLALGMNVPIVPVRISGLFEALPYGKVLPKFIKVNMRIGKPILFKEIEDKNYIEVTSLIEKRVRAL